MSPQTRFAAALLDPDMAAPAGLCSWNGSDPAQRFGVYRNNVVVSLVDALADTFDVTRQLVGDEFFRAMAACHARANPPPSPVLAYYGAEFPDFVAAFAPARSVPYLADVARLEYARVVSFHAADVPSRGGASRLAALTDPARVGKCRLVLAPALQPVMSPHPIVSIWAAHQGDGSLETVPAGRAEAALVWREQFDVVILPVAPATARFVVALMAGATICEALESAPADEGVDAADVFGAMIRRGMLVDVIEQ
jgi:hypothetical protein